MVAVNSLKASFKLIDQKIPIINTKKGITTQIEYPKEKDLISFLKKIKSKNVRVKSKIMRIEFIFRFQGRIPIHKPNNISKTNLIGTLG